MMRGGRGRRGRGRRGRGRRGVAATLTSVLVFSSILAVNQIVYSSENQWLRAVSVAEMEHAEGLNSRIFAAAAVLDLLLGSQTSPQQRASLSCEANRTMTIMPGRNVSAIFERSFTTSIRGVSYSLNASMRHVDVGPASLDNLTLLGPFAGFQNGSLNFVVHISMRATAGPGDPYYSKGETHFVHLPAPVDLSRQRCLSVLGELVDRDGRRRR